MRLVVEKWVLTRTLNQQTNITEGIINEKDEENKINGEENIRNDLVIEQTSHQDQMLYQNDSFSDQSDNFLSMTNLDDTEEKANNNQVSTIYMNINNDSQINQNKPTNFVYTYNNPYKRNEIIVYLDNYSTNETSSSNLIKEKSTSNNGTVLTNTHSLMEKNKCQLEKDYFNNINNNNNNSNNQNLPDSMSTTLLLDTKNQSKKISKKNKINNRRNSCSVKMLNESEQDGSTPILYLQKSRSNSFSSSNEKLTNISHNSNPRQSIYENDQDSYYWDHDSRASSLLASNNNSLNQSYCLKNSNIENWNKYIDLLNKSLNLFKFRETASLIEEFIKLETYLLNEFKSYEKEEKDMNFQSRQQIVDFLNRNLQMNLFRLSQSTTLFDELKSKLIKILKSNHNHLSNDNLNFLLSEFNSLEHDYIDFFELTKSKAKLKMAKYEKYVNTWNDFDLMCSHLEDLFEKSSPGNMSSLKYRALIIEINKCLNRLKEQLSLLTSIINERKYFDLKNLIVIYELKFKKLQEECDSSFVDNSNKKSVKTTKIKMSSTLKNEEYILNQSMETSLESNTTNSSSNESFELENKISKSKKYYNKIYELKGQDSLAKELTTSRTSSPSILKSSKKENEFYNNRNKKIKKHVKLNLVKKETSDKSTTTIHEVATQTDKEKANIGTNTDDNHLLLLINQQKPKQSVSKSNTDQNNNLSPNNSKSKTSNKSNSPNLEYLDRAQADGKQYLLETYLRNNEVPGTSASTSSSGALLSKKSNIMQTSNTRESGIGTVNDDECEMDSLHSATHTFDENLTDLTDNNKLLSSITSKSNDLYDEHENSSINVRSSLNNQIKLRRKPKSLKNTKKTSNVKLDVKEKYDLMNDLKQNELFDEIDNVMNNDDLPQNQKTPISQENIIKKLCTFLLLFLFPILFLIFVYYVYTYYLNPSCCDFKRNYLLINIT